MNAKSVLLAL